MASLLSLSADASFRGDNAPLLPVTAHRYRSAVDRRNRPSRYLIPYARAQITRPRPGTQHGDARIAGNYHPDQYIARQPRHILAALLAQ